MILLEKEYSSAADFCFLFISFLFDESDHWKVISYQFEYIVQDEVGGYTIVVYFYNAMVN